MPKVSIESKRLKELERAEAKLNALEAGGVANWDWYDEALKDYNVTIQKEEDAEELAAEICATLACGVDEPAGRGAGFSFKADAYDTVVQLLLEKGKS